MHTLAKLHKASQVTEDFLGGILRHPAHLEFEKHNKELRKVRKFIKGRALLFLFLYAVEYDTDFLPELY